MEGVAVEGGVAVAGKAGGRAAGADGSTGGKAGFCARRFAWPQHIGHATNPPNHSQAQVLRRFLLRIAIPLHLSCLQTSCQGGAKGEL
jgi:hypothetical protein